MLHVSEFNFLKGFVWNLCSQGVPDRESLSTNPFHFNEKYMDECRVIKSPREMHKMHVFEAEIHKMHTSLVSTNIRGLPN